MLPGGNFVHRPVYVFIKWVLSLETLGSLTGKADLRHPHFRGQNGLTSANRDGFVLRSGDTRGHPQKSSRRRESALQERGVHAASTLADQSRCSLHTDKRPPGLESRLQPAESLKNPTVRFSHRLFTPLQLPAFCNGL